MAEVLKEKWFENDGICSFTNNKQIKLETANDSARVSGQASLQVNAPLTERTRGRG